MQIFCLQVELQKSDMRYSQSASLWELSASLTFPFLRSGMWKNILPLRLETGRVSSRMGKMICRSWFCTSFLRSSHNWLNNAVQSFVQEVFGKVSYLLVLETLKKCSTIH